jgi:hypothetical protein
LDIEKAPSSKYFESKEYGSRTILVRQWMAEKLYENETRTQFLIKNQPTAEKGQWAER